MLNQSTMKHDIFQSSWKCTSYPADEEPLSSWYCESLAFSQPILKGKRHGTVANSVIPSECTWSCLEVKYSRASLAVGWETLRNPTGMSQWAMLNYKNWISSKTLLSSAFMTEYLKNKRRRVVGQLTIVSAFEKLLILKSFSAPFFFPFLFFPFHHLLADFLTCEDLLMLWKGAGGNQQQFVFLPQVREESRKELLLPCSSVQWNVPKPVILSRKLENFKSQAG